MSADGRLDLDDLGQVIEQASSLDEVVGTEDVRPTLGERMESSGVLPWVRRHRGALGAAAAAVVALGATAWFRHDPRPPDDGLPHVAVTDSISNQGLTNEVQGLLTSIYTVVAQRPGDTVALLGVTGPGIRATSAGRPVLDSHDDARASTPVNAVLGCDDPRALDAREDDYHLLVSRTDSYGRTIEAQVPMPAGSQNRWGITVGSTCLQTLALTKLSVQSVAARAVPGLAMVLLDVEVRNGFDRELALDVLGYPGMPVRPDTTTTTIPGGTTRTLQVRESLGNCEAPHLEGTILSPDGQSGMGVTDRTLDVYVRTVTESPDATSAGVPLSWSAAASRPVTAAFAAACAGMPAYGLTVVSAEPAPEAARDAAVLQNGDPSTSVLRAVLEVRTAASAVTVSVVMAGEDPMYGGMPQVTVIDVATGRAVGPQTVPAPVRVVDGRARVTFDWMLSCSGAYSPPTARVLLARDGRTWPLLVNLDDRGLAAGVLRMCPGVTVPLLLESGWSSMQPPRAG